jgi:hypothetical protein
VVIRLAGPAVRMTTGTERGGVRMTFQGFPSPNSTLTLLDEGSYTVAGAVGFLILEAAGHKARPDPVTGVTCDPVTLVTLVTLVTF